jgi:hypothetical protein
MLGAQAATACAGASSGSSGAEQFDQPVDLLRRRRAALDGPHFAEEARSGDFGEALGCCIRAFSCSRYTSRAISLNAASW